MQAVTGLSKAGPPFEKWATRALDLGAVYLFFNPKQGVPVFTVVDREELKQQETTSALVAFIKERLKVPDAANVRVWWSWHDDPSTPGPQGIPDDTCFKEMVWVARSWVIDEQ